jgi:DNA replication and repair protein RecF
MHIEHLALRNFRSYERFDGGFSPLGAVVAGPNGSGKSNILEALAYPSLCRSFRGARDRALLRNGAAFFWVKTRARDDRSVKREVAVLCREGQKQWNLDGQRVPSAWEAVGHVRLVSFSWGDMALVREGPAPLRSYLDAVAVHLGRMHLRSLRGFLRALRQRNGLLSRRTPDSALEAWDEVLARHAAGVVRGRGDAAETVNRELAGLFDTVSGLGGELGIAIGDDVGLPVAASERERITHYKQVLRDARARDRIAGHTTRGPHRDRVSVTLRGQELRSHASDGEQRIAALCLRLAQAAVRGSDGEPPILILDDPLAGLDRERSNSLARFVERRPGQTFVSCQDPARAKRFARPLVLVGNGRVWRTEAA